MVFAHIAPVAFLILGLAFVNLMTNVTALVANKAQVKFYWPHTIFCFITFFTMILFWWTSYPLNNLDFYPNSSWNLFTYLLFLAVPMGKDKCVWNALRIYGKIRWPKLIEGFDVLRDKSLMEGKVFDLDYGKDVPLQPVVVLKNKG